MTIIIFSCVLAIFLAVFFLFMQPVFNTYAWRIKPRKKVESMSSGDAPRESSILKLCKFLGQLSLASLPALADRNTVNWLKQANLRTPDHLAIFIGIKTLCVIVALVTFLLLASAGGNPFGVVLAILAAGMAWILPNFSLTARVRQRQKNILRELPTIIDLLIVCAQAGLGLLMCIDKVAKETEMSCTHLSSELTQFINDVKVFSKPSKVALADMADRCGLDELASICSALISAESKGSDISYPLRQQAEALRDKMKRKKEEEASKVPVKMVPVIVVFILPLIICPMLGPAVVTIFQSLGPSMGAQSSGK
jgi:tight adherence protein C